jgi:hypothetical protein
MQSLVHLKLMPFDDLNTTLPKAPPLLSLLFKNATASELPELELITALSGGCKHGSSAGGFDGLFLLHLYALSIVPRELMLLIVAFNVPTAADSGCQ